MALFGISEQIKKAFDKAGKDISELKSSMNSWVIHLNGNHAEMRKKLIEMDVRIRELEMEKVREMMK